MLDEILKSSAIRKACEAGSFQSAAGLLRSIERPVVDTRRRNASDLIKLFNVVIDQQTQATEADIILASLQRSTVPRVKAAYLMLAGEGLDVSSEQTQSLIDYLAQADGWPEGLRERVKALGRRIQRPFQSVTTEAVQSVWQQYEETVQEQRQSAARSAIVATLRRLADQIEASTDAIVDDLRNEIVDSINANWPEV